MSDRLADGRVFRILTIVDQFSRECPLLEPGLSLTGKRVVECLDRLACERGLPESITIDNGSEFCSRALDTWAYQRGVKLDFIRPGKPVENGYVESRGGGGAAWVRTSESLKQQVALAHLLSSFFHISKRREKAPAK